MYVKPTTYRLIVVILMTISVIITILKVYLGV